MQGATHQASRHMYAACEVRRDRVFLYMYNCSPGLRQQLDQYVTRALAWQVCKEPGASMVEHYACHVMSSARANGVTPLLLENCCF
jgi:hypothetical protein